jgi:hypothetical protein
MIVRRTASVSIHSLILFALMSLSCSSGSSFLPPRHISRKSWAMKEMGTYCFIHVFVALHLIVGSTAASPPQQLRLIVAVRTIVPQKRRRSRPSPRITRSPFSLAFVASVHLALGGKTGDRIQALKLFVVIKIGNVVAIQANIFGVVALELRQHKLSGRKRGTHSSMVSPMRSSPSPSSSSSPSSRSGTSPSLASPSDPDEKNGLGGDEGSVGPSLEAVGGRRGASESRRRLLGLIFELYR